MAAKSKLTDSQREEIKQKYALGTYTYQRLAEEYGVSMGTIMLSIKNKYQETPSPTLHQIDNNIAIVSFSGKVEIKFINSEVKEVKIVKGE